MLYLQQHVSRFNSAVGCYGATFHYRADVYASISSVITLPHDADAQEIILLCRKDFSIAFTQQCMVTIISVTVTRLMMILPMLRVTVMMLRLMVESVMLLNDEDCHKNTQKRFPLWNAHDMSLLCHMSLTLLLRSKKFTLSILATFCLRRRRLCLRMSWVEVLCSVELLNLRNNTKESIHAKFWLVRERKVSQ